MIATYSAQRYVQPLREGGSLPAIVDTDGGLFVVKFRGAGQGPKALIAELITGLLARTIALPVPELAVVDIADSFGRAEPDPEIQEILRASHGANVGLQYLDGAFNFDGFAASEYIDDWFASTLVWLDAFTTNPDRTHRNPNLLVWQRTPWLIDHGASLYAHHSWSDVDEARTRTRFPLIRDHVLLAHATAIADVDADMERVLTADAIDRVLAAVPDALLTDPVIAGEFDSAEAARARYRAYLNGRMRAPRDFVQEAVAAREMRLREPVQRRQARR